MSRIFKIVSGTFLVSPEFKGHTIFPDFMWENYSQAYPVNEWKDQFALHVMNGDLPSAQKVILTLPDSLWAVKETILQNAFLSLSPDDPYIYEKFE